VLLLPISGHWLSGPLANAVTDELADQLSASGFAVSAARRDGAVALRAVLDGWISEEDLAVEDLEETSAVLAVAAGADVRLAGEIIEEGGEVKLLGRLTGTLSGRSVEFEMVTAAGRSREAVARALAEKVLGVLTPAVWAAVGADEDGRRAGAEQRYAAGQVAMAAGMYEQATLEFEAALLGASEKPEYLRSAAEARVGSGDLTGAVIRLRRLAGLKPADVEVALRIGEVALLAGKPQQAEAAFLSAETLWPSDPRVVEGLARSARARGDFARSEVYYKRLLSMVGVDSGFAREHAAGAPPEPGGLGVVDLAAESRSLASLLARQDDDTVRLAGIPPEAVGLQLSRLYFRAGDQAAGLRALFAYHAATGAPTYTAVDYSDVSPALDDESEAIVRRVQEMFAARVIGDLDDDEADAEMDGLHDRSDLLVVVADQISVPAAIDSAHRYRVLAYSLLNQSNFEALMFLRTGDSDRKRRADLLRTAFRKAREQGQRLGEELLGGETGG
jgi:tetratricopeptide (TPR) repeat protein